MSSRSQLLHRTYGGSPNWLLDHHQPVPRVLHNCCGRQYHRVLAALKWSGWQRMIPRKSPACLALDRGLLQQNLPRAAVSNRSKTSPYSISSSARTRIASSSGTARPRRDLHVVMHLQIVEADRQLIQRYVLNAPHCWGNLRWANKKL